MSATKVCCDCREEKPRSAFHRDVGRRPDGLHRRCRECRNRVRREKHTRTYGLRYYHGITQEQFDRLEFEQGGRCALCGTDTPGGHGGWHVDHDHRCCPGARACGNCVRGLLCSLCNLHTGIFEKFVSEGRVDAVLSYIDRKVIW